MTAWKPATLASSLAFALAACGSVHAATIHVAPSGGDYESIQEGLSAAAAGDTVLVAPGTYAGALNRELDFSGLGIVLVSDGGPDVTTIDCEGLGRAFLFDDGEDTLAIVDGFTVEDGDADRGGAILVEAASPAIRNCRFQGCSSTEAGGAIMIDHGHTSVTACTFTDNTSDVGGAVATFQAEGRFADCAFLDNSASYGGSAACEFSPSPSFSDCDFFDSRASVDGGSVYLLSSSPSIDRCSFFRSRSRRGAVAGQYSSPELSFCVFGYCRASARPGAVAIDLRHTDIDPARITNCTITSWSLGGACTALAYFEDCAPVVEATILAFHNQGGAAACAGVGSPTFLHCISYGNSGGDDLPGDSSDNLVTDPLFCDFWIDNLTLSGDSPCLPLNNPWGIAVGALGQACPGSQPTVEHVTWGKLKAMYR